MPTLTFKATEMKDAKVAHISLVNRAATRIPFKVIKQEKPMSVLRHLDLASVFKRDKQEPKAVGACKATADCQDEKDSKMVKPGKVSSVVTMKSDDYASVKAQIEEAGFITDAEEDQQDGSVVLAQVEDQTGDHVLIRLSDCAILAVKGFTPYGMDLTTADGSTFTDVCKSQGFFPGISSVMESLRSEVLQMAETSEDASETSVQVSKMFDEAKKYAVSMVQGLPSKAFKLESIFPVEEGNEEVVIDAIPAEEFEIYDTVLKDSAASAKAWASRRANSAASAKANRNQLSGLMANDTKKAKRDLEDQKSMHQMFLGHMANDTKLSKAKAKIMAGPSIKEQLSQGGQARPAKKDEDVSLTPEAVSGMVTEIVGKQIEEFTTKMENLLGGVSKAVAGVGSNVQALTQRVEVAEGVAKAAARAIEGTVVLGGEGGDHAEVALKNEGGYRGREIDTAFRPRGQSNSAVRR